MATFTGKASGNSNATGQTTWNEAGIPAAGDTVDVNGFIITVPVGVTQGWADTSNGGAATGKLIVNGTCALTGTMAPSVAKIDVGAAGSLTLATVGPYVGQSWAPLLDISGVFTVTTAAETLNIQPASGSHFHDGSVVTFSGLPAVDLSTYTTVYGGATVTYIAWLPFATGGDTGLFYATSGITAAKGIKATITAFLNESEYTSSLIINADLATHCHLIFPAEGTAPFKIGNAAFELICGDYTEVGVGNVKFPVGYGIGATEYAGTYGVIDNATAGATAGNPDNTTAGVPV